MSKPRVVYDPVVWLHGNTFLFEPLESYWLAWGW